MADLIERVIQAGINARMVAMRQPGAHDYNLITAEVAIDIVLEEVAEAFDSNGDWPQMIPQDEVAAALRAKKGGGDG